jgi:hypothetical protein
MVWPISNRAESLQIDFFYIQRQVGKYLDYDYDPALWDDEQTQAVQEIIDEGVRQYYFPPVLPPAYAAGARHVHEWSFMRPIFRLETKGTQRRYPLPEDWERPVGNLAYVNTANDFYQPIQWTSSSRLRNLEYQSNFTTYPQFAAYEPDESQGDGPQTQILVLHPTPDSSYELSCQYQSLARRLTKEHPYPLGGQMHGRGFLASCLAAAELRLQGAEGPMFAKFLQVLASNIVRDEERGAKLLGYNGNTENVIRGRGMLRGVGGIYYSLATYDGNSFPGG